MKTQFTDNLKHQSLWDRLASFEITPPNIALTFESRLAREQAWGLDRALAVTQEYRKFLFLLLITDHPVTPSEDIDAAWHLHLLYTRSYQQLCNEIAGTFIHHNPTEGGSSEKNKFIDQYQRTLELYEAWFGPPPADIWPAADRRFATAGAGQWFNPSTHFLVPRPQELIRRWIKTK